MSQKLHVNPETGHVGKCSATVKECQFGEQNHFDTPLEAVRYAEKIIEENVANPQRTLRKRSHVKRLKISDAEAKVDKVDIDSLREIVVNGSDDKLLLEQGYFQGETVGEIRENFIKEYEKVAYAKDIRREIAQHYASLGYDAEVVTADDSVPPYVNFTAPIYSDGGSAIKFDVPGREKITEGEYKGYLWESDYYDDERDEYPIGEKYAHYALSDDEAKEARDFEVKQLLSKKIELVSDEKLPDWIVLPKQAHQAGNKYKNKRVTDGEVSHAEHVLNDAKSLKDKKHAIEQELEMLKNKREGFAVEFAEKLNTSDEDINSISAVYSQRIEGLTRAIVKKEEKLNKIPDLKDTIAKAEANLRNTREKHLAYKEEAFVYHLSRYHPKFVSHRELASDIAQKWLDDNRDKFKVSDFDKVIGAAKPLRDDNYYDWGGGS